MKVLINNYIYDTISCFSYVIDYDIDNNTLTFSYKTQFFDDEDIKIKKINIWDIIIYINEKLNNKINE